MTRPAALLAVALAALIYGPVAQVARAGDEPKTLNATVIEAKDKAQAAPAAPAGDGFTETVCTQGKNKRSVSLSFGNPDTKLPCEVHYKKESEQPGHDQVLFKAANEVTFCEIKAHAFVEKLAGMGWSCGKT